MGLFVSLNLSFPALPDLSSAKMPHFRPENATKCHPIKQLKHPPPLNFMWPFYVISGHLGQFPADERWERFWRTIVFLLVSQRKTQSAANAACKKTWTLYTYWYCQIVLTINRSQLWFGSLSDLLELLKKKIYFGTNFRDMKRVPRWGANGCKISMILGFWTNMRG